MSVVDLLKGHGSFKAMNEDELNKVGRFTTIRSYGKDETVFAHDSPGSHIYVLVEGRIRLWMPASSGEFSLVIGHIQRGELFGLSPLIGSGRYTTTARCAVPSEILAIEASPLKSLLEENTHMGFHFLKEVSQAYFARYIESLKRFQGILDHIVD